MTATFVDPNQTFSRFGPDGVARNGNGQYLVLPPNGTKPVGYSRATTIAKLLDDTTNLELWKLRTAAEGLTARPDLFSLLQVADFDDKHTINDLITQALDAGGATVRRNQGTALHGVFEKHWTEPGWQVPAANAGDITAVETALTEAGFELCGWHEVMVVHDAHKIAGKFDLLLHHTSTGRYVVADLKTGGSVDFGGLSFAVQLHLYASADAIYTQGASADGSEDERTPMPIGVDQERGLIIHVEPGSGVCDLHWVDLTIGAEALQLALEVRKMRNRGRKALSKLDRLDLPAAPQETERPERLSRRDWLADRVRTISAAEADPALLVEMNIPSAAFLLAGWWPDGVPYLSTDHAHTDAELDAIAERCALVEKHLQLSFPEPDPAVEAANDRVPGDDPRIVSITAALELLPADLANEVIDTAGIAGKLTAGRATVAEVQVAERALEGAARARQERLDDIARILAPVAEITDSAVAHVTRLVNGYGVDTWEPADVALCELVVEAVCCGYLGDTPDGLAVTDACEALLVKVFGDKRKTLAAARRACKAHHMAPPSKFVDVLAHPVLVAVTIGAPEPDGPAAEADPSSPAAA